MGQPVTRPLSAKCVLNTLVITPQWRQLSGAAMTAIKETSTNIRRSPLVNGTRTARSDPIWAWSETGTATPFYKAFVER